MSAIPDPELRPAPPWAMQDMIEAEPAMARSIFGDADAVGALAVEVSQAAGANGRVLLTGCGTSEHAAMAIAAFLGEALADRDVPRGSVSARVAFEAALEPWPVGLVIGVSHEAETAATIAAMQAGRDAGARSALITANGAGRALECADVRVVTPLLDRSWCHTVGYLAPLLAGAAAATIIAETPLEGDAMAGVLAAVLAGRDAAQTTATGLRAATTFVTVGSGIDYTAARELALKIEEGVRLPASARDTETELHGHLVAASRGTALIAVVADPRQTRLRAERAVQLLRACTRLGMPTAAIVSAEANDLLPADVTSAGRIVLPQATPGGAVARLAETAAASAIALQLLALELLTLHDRNPDLIGRENADQREAAAFAAPFPS